MIPVEIFIIVVLVLLAINYFVFQYGRKKGANDFAQLCFIAGLMGKTQDFEHFNKYSKPGGVVFLGDSITQDFNVYEYFPEHRVYNRGIGADTSKGVLGRLNESVFQLKPKKVFLNIGTNDLDLIDDGIDAIFSRISEIIEKIQNSDKNLILYFISIYPVNPNVTNTPGKRKNEDISELNKRIQEITGINYINIYDKLLKDGFLNPDYTIEGLHMNQSGYEVIKAEIIKHI
ncbi:MAG: lysophospholipase [Tenericutes bacterium]|nr:lysophospholipase [Mycoplasmatota bacterium]